VKHPVRPRRDVRPRRARALLRAGAVAGLALTVTACAPVARAPSTTSVDLATPFARAFHLDATGDPHEAVRAYLDLVQVASRADGNRWQVAALEASLDALVGREIASFDGAARDASLAARSVDGPAIADALTADVAGAQGPFARGLLARALTTLAERRGDAARAARWRAATGCAREAIVIGPTTWAAITGVHESGPLDRADARIESAYSTDGVFAPQVHPVPVPGRGCAIELDAESTRPGVREVVFDVAVGRAQTIGLVLRAHGAAEMRTGGYTVLRRPFELGDGEAARFVRIAVSAGTVRLVARVGTAKDEDSVELDAFSDEGAPLRVTAPAIGSGSIGLVRGLVDTLTPAPMGDDEALLVAAAALAEGDPRDAEGGLSKSATRPDARPDVALVYARAVESARDLSAASRAERARSAYGRALEGWPASWEAAIGHAVMAGARRGHDEAGLETLRDLEETRARSSAATSPVLDAFEAMTAGRERLFDRARAALARARPSLGETALAADAEDAASPRVGAELVAAECDGARPTAHDTLACLDALHAVGDRTQMAGELARIRTLLEAPSLLSPFELREALIAGDTTTSERVFDAMLPAERTMGSLSRILDGAGSPLASDARARLVALAANASDAPGSIAPLLAAWGSDSSRAFDAIAERVAAEDRATPILPDAATAVLAHIERYDVSRDGRVHWTLFDERRVLGTTDIEDNAQAAPPDVWGRSAQRAVRRRILKKDGRVLEPDRAPRAAQAHADLSQLEPGDAVEAIYEGWSLPGDTGDIGIDTPDLLPDRTAVHGATIELRLPRGLRGSLWSHALLGPPVERADGDQRVLTWQLADRPARRTEDGVPKMDRNVSVSFSTARWAGIARALRETVAGLDEHDPEISAWASEAAGAAKTPRAIVDAIVSAAGEALRESDAGTLSDYGGGIAAVQTQTARTFLTSHDGSRAWLVLRALRQFGIASDLVVAENDPYSADPSFPPHYGRFVHPLVVAHLPARSAAEDVWIDADVAGPPLPAGRISPELRGRMALRPDGTLTPLPALSSGPERDEVDVRLALDPEGNARGTFAVVLRGREAQELAEALFRIVGAERQRALREVVLAWLPWANVDDVELASTEGSWQISLRAGVSVSGYAQAEQTASAGRHSIEWLLPGLDTLHWAWPRARVSNLAATFATRSGRESALAVSAAVQYHVHRRLELPPGAVVKRMPGPLDVQAKLVDASRKMSVGSGVIEDDFTLGVATGTVATGDYDAFVATAHRADDGFMASTRISLP
jgi:hypothetical protein